MCLITRIYLIFSKCADEIWTYYSCNRTDSHVEACYATGELWCQVDAVRTKARETDGQNSYPNCQKDQREGAITANDRDKERNECERKESWI